MKQLQPELSYSIPPSGTNNAWKTSLVARCLNYVGVVEGCKNS